MSSITDNQIDTELSTIKTLQNLGMVLASNNSGKVREINELLNFSGIRIRAQEEFGIPEAEETGLSFVENAIIKARHASLHTGLAALADDSGIEVDALNGAPGIRSARYAGIGAGDEANLRKLLAVMEGIPDAKRTARFQCLLVYMRHAEDPTPIICQGTWEGRLLTSSIGENGFGYDPIFFVPTHGCSSAQLEPKIKNELSHRGQALRALVIALQSKILFQN